MNKYIYNIRFNKTVRPILNISGEIENNNYLVVYSHPSQYWKTFVGILSGSQSKEGNNFVYILKQTDTEVIQGTKDVPLKLKLPLSPATVSFIPLGFNGVKLNIIEE